MQNAAPVDDRDDESARKRGRKRTQFMHRTSRCGVVRPWAVVLVSALLLVPLSVYAQEQPMIERIEPMAGPVGTAVQIIGRGFGPDLRVLFNEHQIPVVSRLPERITVEIPAGAQSGRFVVAHG